MRLNLTIQQEERYLNIREVVNKNNKIKREKKRDATTATTTTTTTTAAAAAASHGFKRGVWQILILK